MVVLTLGRICKFIPLRRHKGGGVDGTPPRSFWYVAVFRNDLAFSGKSLIFLKRFGILYGWWRCWRPVTSPTMVAFLAAIFDLLRIRNQLKTARNGNFLCLKWTLYMILATRITFTNERSWKYMYFYSKMAWPAATYDVISPYHSNWPSLNLSQNVREG